MNLWAKSFGRLTVLAVALFFFSCEDETSLLGLKNPKPKFNVSYVEIPIESSVMLIDSLRTTNFYGTSETNRFLVGKYSDDKFGEITSSVFTQFFPASTSKTLLKESAVFDSVSVELRFDFYTYGSTTESSQTLSIYELEKDLVVDSLGYYFNRSNTTVKPTVLGSKSFSVNPTNFKKYITDQKDTTLVVKVPIDFAFGKRIFDSAMKYRTSTNAVDSSYARYREFIKEFKGIAILPDLGDKVVGFAPSAAASRIVLHYHDATADSLQLGLSFVSVAGYNQIRSDRSATADLSALTQFHQELPQVSDLRYIQSGTGVVTKIDLTQFYTFADQDSNKNVLINSAELLIKNTEISSQFDPIGVLSLRALNSNNRFRKLADKDLNPAQYTSDSIAINRYRSMLTASGGLFTPVSDLGSPFVMVKDSDGDSYNGFLTLYIQETFYKNDKPRFPYWVLYPESPQIGKSLNRIVFNKNDLVLKVYYTRPILTSTP
jgi:hypothetical protein